MKYVLIKLLILVGGNGNQNNLVAYKDDKNTPAWAIAASPKYYIVSKFESRGILGDWTQCETQAF